MSDIDSDILSKIERYCSYQERCLFEVKQKLWSFDLKEETTEKIIVLLQDEGYINQERFVERYIASKLTRKKWGKIKIKAALKGKHIDSKLIDDKIKGIDDTAYKKMVHETLEKKRLGLNKKTTPKKQQLLFFGKSKGYSFEDIMDFINKHEIK